MIQTHVSGLPPTVDTAFAFPTWVAQHCDVASAVLEVGAGSGKDGESAIIRQKVRYLIGTDPDAGILRNPYLDEQHQTSVEDFARDRASSFDCIYSMYVLEHITHPPDFFAACRSLLRPGGKLFGATPNLWHYFGMATKVSACLGIEDRLLARLIGMQLKATYHFPTTYRVNSVRAIRRVLAQTGFQSVEFICVDHPQSFEYVFPRALRWFPSSYSRVVNTLRLPAFMGLIMFKATA